MLKFYNELKRRKVIKTLGAYAAAAFVTMQVADTVFPRLGFPDWTVAFVIFLLVLGFPITFFFSWTYDIRRESETDSKLDSEEILQDGKSKKILLPITGFLTIIGVVFWAWYSFVGFTSAADVDLQSGIKKSIAILHFDNLTGDREGDYFCSALTEQVRGSLSKLGKLDIASRLITDKIKNKSKNESVYEDLDYYVEGTLSKVSDNNNINVSLINANNHKVRWAHQYTFSENEIVQYGDTILNNIALNLNIDYKTIQLLSNTKNNKNSGVFKLMGQGLFEFENSNFKSALSAFNSVLQSSPGDHNALFHKAQTLVRLEREDEAIQIYNNLISQTKHDHFGWEWSLKKRDDVDNGLYAAFNDL